jgi:hypothetical protein
LGTNTNVGGGVAALTVTTVAAVPAGAIIIVCADSDLRPNQTVVSSITDTAGNTYRHAAGGLIGQNIGAEAWYAQNALALATGSAITVNWAGGTADVTVTALTATGAATSSALDGAVAVPEATAARITVTAYPSVPGELAVVYWVARNAQGQPQTDTPGWTSLAAFAGTNGVGHYVQVAWNIVPAAGPVTVVGSTPSPGTGWAGILVTFRPVLIPTATGSLGGSSAIYHVQAIAGTANGALGVSGAQPADLAPYAPPIIPAFTAGYTPLPADFTQWVRRSLGYCTNKIAFRAQATVGQSLSAATWAALVFGSVLEDPFGGWSATATGSQAAASWLAPYTGWFRVTWRYCVSAVSAFLDAGIGVSGVNPTYEAEGCTVPASLPGGAGGSVVVPMIGGADYVQALARSSVNATTATGAGLAAYVEITPAQTDPQG